MEVLTICPISPFSGPENKEFSRKWNLVSVWNQETEASVSLCIQLQPSVATQRCLRPTHSL